MDANLFYFIASIFAAIIISFLTIMYDQPLKEWLEKRRLIKRLKRLEKEKEIYWYVYQLRTDAVFRQIHLPRLRAKMNHLYFGALFLLSLIVILSTNFVPEHKLVDGSSVAYVKSILDIIQIVYNSLTFLFALVFGVLGA